MKPYDLLTAAQERIRDPQRWTQGAAARNERGDECSPWDKTACRWCSFGAVVAERPEDRDSLPFLSNAAFSLFRSGFICVNDDKGHDAVMQVFTLARELALQEANVV